MSNLLPVPCESGARIEDLPLLAADGLSINPNSFLGDCEENWLKRMAGSVWVLSALVASVCTLLVWIFQVQESCFSWPVFFFGALVIAAPIKFSEMFIQLFGREEREREAPVWKGITSKLVFIFGLMLPSIISVAVSFSAIYNPAGALMMAYLTTPPVNLCAWKELKRGVGRRPWFLRFLMGFSLISQIFLIFSCAVNGPLDQTAAARWLLFSPLLIVFVVSSILAYKLWRNCDPCVSPRVSPLIASGLVGLAIFGPHVPALWLTTQLAAVTSQVPELRRFALASLDSAAAIEIVEQKLDPFNYSMPSHVYPSDVFDPSRELCQEAYYLISGRSPDSVSESMSWMDPYAGAPVIGNPSSGLKIKHSSLDGKLDTHKLTANFDWTLEFTNSNSSSVEARLEMHIPEGGVVSDLHLLPAADRKDAAPLRIEPALFGANLAIQHTYSRDAELRRDPALITMLAPDRALLRCSPILTGAEFKVRVHIVAPFSADQDEKSVYLRLPRIVGGNVVAENTQVHVESIGDVKRGYGFDRARAGKEEESSRGDLKLAKPGDTVYSSSTVKTLTLNEGSSKIIRELVREDVPRSVVMAVDGSVSNADAKGALTNFFKSTPRNIEHVVLADPSRGILEVAPACALATIQQGRFCGGDDNWVLLERAISIARQNRSDVVWVHGPKSWNLKSQFQNWSQGNWSAQYGVYCPYDLAKLCGGTVHLYDFQTAPGGNEILERIHASVLAPLPIVTIDRKGGTLSDLNELFKRWITNEPTKHFVFRTLQSSKSKETREHSASDIAVLANQEELTRLVRAGESAKAQQFAERHKLVSIYTGALARRVSLCSPGEGGEMANEPHSSVELNDPMVIAGVSTGGTVRVNNLANVEAILNIFANAVEVIFTAWGFVMIVWSVRNFKSSSRSRVRFVLGLLFLGGGWGLIAVINWLIASCSNGGGFS